MAIHLFQHVLYMPNYLPSTHLRTVYCSSHSAKVLFFLLAIQSSIHSLSLHVRHVWVLALFQFKSSQLMVLISPSCQWALILMSALCWFWVFVYSRRSTRLLCYNQADGTCEDTLTHTHKLYTILRYLTRVTLCLLFQMLYGKHALESNT